MSSLRNEVQRKMIPNSLQCDMCSVFSFATVDLYLQQMSIRNNDLCKIAKEAFGNHMCSIGVHLSTLCFLNKIFEAVCEIKKTGNVLFSHHF